MLYLQFALLVLLPLGCWLTGTNILITQDKAPPPAAATATPNKVKGLTVPASITITASDVRKKIVPVFDNPSLVLDVKFKVIASGDTDPSYTVKGTGKDSYIELDVPKDKEAYLVFTYALYQGDKPWMTDAAQTIVEWGSGLPPPTTTPPDTTPPVTTPPVTTPPAPLNVDQVFASVKNVHAMLVLDVKSANPEVAVLTQNKNVFTQHFVQPGTGNAWWQYDIRSIALAQAQIMKLVDAQGKVIIPLPAVVLIDNTVKPAKMIGVPIPVALTGNPTNTITNILTAIATALKR